MVIRGKTLDIRHHSAPNIPRTSSDREDICTRCNSPILSNRVPVTDISPADAKSDTGGSAGFNPDLFEASQNTHWLRRLVREGDVQLGDLCAG